MRVYILAGLNGAGKSTFALRHLKCPHINPDILPDLRQVNPIIKKLMSLKIDFSIETTLSGRSYIKFIKQFREAGYRVIIYYIKVDNVDKAKCRIKKRVLLGGHDIPDYIVEKRFKVSYPNFLEIYEPLSDVSVVFDNSTHHLKLLEIRKLV
jgi:predicted ABC-type ATPase